MRQLQRPPGRFLVPLSADNHGQRRLLHPNGIPRADFRQSRDAYQHRIFERRKPAFPVQHVPGTFQETGQ
ncbi:hypothetical protein L596_014112 [Steinernema carpocapsae]|uniref:Uncharacterized protein n=1 Tax=Steinernema carpocapsae TaxID=34508 RepID=A0A4U5NC35_STECR|nr:hypothetical protein L596_014112 [Steinernema carpocapsae]